MYNWINSKLLKECPTSVFPYLSIIGGFIIQLTLGSVYTYGNMSPYMIKYMFNHTNPKQGVNAGNAMWIFGLSVFGLGVTMSAGGFMVPRMGAVTSILVGCWTMSFGVLASYWTINTHLGLVCITYGLMTGLGIGIAYGIVISIPSEWFPNHKGLVTGIVVAGFGFSPITLDFIQSYYINPNITKVKLCDTSKVPFSFVLMGSIYAAMQLIGAIMIRRPKIDLSISDPNEEYLGTTINSLFDEINQSEHEVNVSPQRIIFEKDFWILWITYTLNSIVAVLILSLHKVFGETLVISDIWLTIFTATGALFNGVGRITWGYLVDKSGFKVLMTILTVSMSAVMGTFFLCTKVGDITKENDHYRMSMYGIWIILLHFLLGGNYSIYPVICVQRFGKKYSVINYGILFTAYALAGIVTSATTTLVTATTHKDSRQPQGATHFLPIFLVGSAISLFSTIFTQIYRGINISNRISHLRD